MTERTIFHVDANCAFLSWEAVYRLKHLHGTLDLREIAAAVGGSQEARHGIILAKSIPCKQYGIKTGESIMEAKRKCPNLMLVPPHYDLYERCSKAFVRILEDYTPDVEQYSIDESFMDMTGTEGLWGSPLKAANQIRERIHDELGFTVNIGVSNNKLLAKMASDFKKPNLVHTLYPDEIAAKMWPLPVTELFYVGRATSERLQRLGIRTIGDLAHTDVGVLRQHMKSHGDVIWNYANGNEMSAVERTAPAAKGYGNSTTLPHDVTDYDSAGMVLLSLAETVGMRLRKDRVKIEVVAASIKYADFSCVVHQGTLYAATNITKEIYQMAFRLFRELWDGVTPIRHMGIRASRVQEGDTARQLSLFDLAGTPLNNQPSPDFAKLEKADAAIDKIRAQYGKDAVKRAVFLASRMDHAAGGIKRDKYKVDYSKLKIE